jgi:uncharacterized protein YqgC (DUF456 family)
MEFLSDNTILVATLLCMLVGLLGSVLPGLPGVPLIFLSALVYGFLTSFETVGAVVLIVLGLFAALAFVMDFLATSYGARRFGASNWGTVGGAVGGIVGALAGALVFGIGSLFGLIIGTIGGVFLGEYLRRQRTPPATEGEPESEPGTPGGRGDWRRASRAAGGVLIGLTVSAISQGVLGLASVAVFVLAVIY